MFILPHSAVGLSLNMLVWVHSSRCKHVHGAANISLSMSRVPQGPGRPGQNGQKRRAQGTLDRHLCDAWAFWVYFHVGRSVVLGHTAYSSHLLFRGTDLPTLAIAWVRVRARAFLQGLWNGGGKQIACPADGV